MYADDAPRLRYCDFWILQEQLSVANDNTMLLFIEGVTS